MLPPQVMDVKGNGDNLGTQFVSYGLSIAGNETVKLNYSANASAKTRKLGLVE
jgi:hypothetical protein